MAEEILHSSIGASSMERWAACPGSVRLSRGLPNISSAYAEEGTRAHELAALALNDKPFSTTDDEMYEHVEAYNAYVKGLLEGRNSTIYVEQKFDISALHPGLFGTADCVIWFPSEKRLVVIDFKYGAGIPVEAVGNKQLRYYALGAYHQLKYDADTIEMHIFQPRCFHPDGPVRTWAIDVFDLMDFQDELLKAARETEKPEARLVSGEQCRFCPAAGVCPQVRSESMALAQTMFAPATVYDPNDLSRVLGKLDVIEDWCKSVRQFAFQELTHGRAIPGWKLVEKVPRRYWRPGAEIEVSLRDIAKNAGFTKQEFESNFYELPKLKSPATVEKLLATKGKKKAMANLVFMQSSGLKLAPEDSKAAAVDVSPNAFFEVIDDIYT